MEKLKEQLLDHPADALAKALDRATELLATLGHLYEPAAESFSGGNTFVAHAVSTAAILVAEARTALDSLHHNCDLTLLDDPATSNSVIEVNFHNDHAEDSFEEEQLPETGEENETYGSSSTVDSEQENIAQSYLELLRKLTAAEVFAAEQQALSVPGTSPEILPLLRSLREDIQKIHKVA